MYAVVAVNECFCDTGAFSRGEGNRVIERENVCRPCAARALRVLVLLELFFLAALIEPVAHAALLAAQKRRLRLLALVELGLDLPEAVLVRLGASCASQTLDALYTSVALDTSSSINASCTRGTSLALLTLQASCTSCASQTLDELLLSDKFRHVRRRCSRLRRPRGRCRRIRRPRRRYSRLRPPQVHEPPRGR